MAGLDEMTVGPLGKILRKHFLTLPRRSQWASDPRRETRLTKIDELAPNSCCLL